MEHLPEVILGTFIGCAIVWIPYWIWKLNSHRDVTDAILNLRIQEYKRIMGDSAKTTNGGVK